MTEQAVKQQKTVGETNKEGLEREDIVQKIAEKMGVAAQSIKVYGEPIERDGTTVIPISKVTYGFGGGMGKQKEQKGSGGGGGLQTYPIGYIEIKDGETKFRQIVDFATLAPLVASSTLALLTLFWGARKLFRNSKSEK